MSGIQDKVVAIAGASSGIGEATALLLAERGAKVVRGSARLEALVGRIMHVSNASSPEGVTVPELVWLPDTRAAD